MVLHLINTLLQRRLMSHPYRVKCTAYCTEGHTRAIERKRDTDETKHKLARFNSCDCFQKQFLTIKTLLCSSFRLCLPHVDMCVHIPQCHKQCTLPLSVTNQLHLWPCQPYLFEKLLKWQICLVLIHFLAIKHSRQSNGRQLACLIVLVANHLLFKRV